MFAFALAIARVHDLKKKKNWYPMVYNDVNVT